MTKIDFPFIVGLKFSFQTDDKLFLIMDYLSGGELFFHLRKQVNNTHESRTCHSQCTCPHIET